MAACVPVRKYEDTLARQQLYADSTRMLAGQYQSLEDRMERLEEQLETLEEQTRALAADTAELGKRYRQAEAMNADLNELYEKVIAQNKALLENTNQERNAVLAELNEKERLLSEQGAELRAREAALADQQQLMAAQQAELAAKQQRVEELEATLNRQDSATNALRQSVADALLGFSSDELTVEKRDGRIYVSMNNKLLFRSGRADVDPKGREALALLATVMQQNPDIQIMVEGHTDSVPLASGGAMKDNWDLSVLRATSITRILTDNGVDPKRVTSSGRGEYFPKADNSTAEGRAQNRRTEIILTPDLSELMQILQQD
jgi:chemotaxis protein MotB